MKRSISLEFLLIFSLIFLFAGCEPENYRWQTVVHEDGSMTRTISQPWDKTADPATQFANWDRQGSHHHLTREYWPGPFSEDRWERVKLNGTSEAHDYLIAEKTVDRIEDFPDHYLIELEETNLKSEVRHKLTVTDYKLVKEYVWTEVITDIVELEKIPQARREFVDLIADATREALERGLGNEYDVSELIEWMKTDGERMLEEFTLLLHAGNQRQLDDLAKDDAEERFRDTFGKYGLLKFNEKAFLDFLRLRLKAGILDRNGKPIDDELVEEILDIENEKNTRHQNIVNAFKNRFRKNSPDAARLKELAAKQFGIYQANLLKTNDQYDIWVRLPGTIVQTNGLLEKNDTARWSFEVNDISPTGYEMKAKSLFPVSIEKSNILPEGKFTKQQEMLTFVELLKSDEELQKAFENALEENSVTPIIQLRDQAYEDTTRNQNGAVEVKPSESRVRWWRANQLLKLFRNSSDRTK